MLDKNLNRYTLKVCITVCGGEKDLEECDVVGQKVHLFVSLIPQSAFLSHIAHTEENIYPAF